jgi:hypothetical protein
MENKPQPKPEDFGFQIVNGYPKPLSFVYENVKNAPGVKQELSTMNRLVKVEYPLYEGILVFTEGSMHPFKGFPADPMDWMHLDNAKRLFIESMRMFKSWQFALGFLLTWNKIKYIESLMRSYNDITFKGMRYLFIKKEYKTPVACEINTMLYRFLIYIEIEKEVAKNFAAIFAHFIEYDNAYRYRLQDIMSETTPKLLLCEPIYEIDRLMLLMGQRDSPGVYEKFRAVKYVFSFLLLFPKYRNAFRYMIEESNFGELQYTPADRYWSYLRTDYKFGGLEYEERSKIYPQKPIETKNKNVA